MKTSITARHFELTEAIKKHIEKKANYLHSHYNFIIEIDFTLEVDSESKAVENQMAEAKVHISGETLHSKVFSKDLYQSIDELTDKLARLLSKHKK